MIFTKLVELVEARDSLSISGAETFLYLMDKFITVRESRR